MTYQNKNKLCKLLPPSLFSEFEIVVEEEPHSNGENLDTITSQQIDELYQKYQKECKKFENDTNESNEQLDTEKEIEEKIDKVFKRFKKVISKEPQQILRSFNKKLRSIYEFEYMNKNREK
jgi:hypothetical protein